MIFRSDINDAPETGDQMRASDLHPVECEVTEVREHLGFQMASQIRTSNRRVGLCARSHQHDARTFQGIAVFAFVQHQRNAGIRQDVFGVQRQI